MHRFKLGVILSAVLFVAVLFGGINTAMAKDSDFIEAFREALYAGDNEKMAKLIDNNLEAVPAEVDAYILEVRGEGMDAAERETGFFLLEMVTTKYKEKTRDAEPLRAFKRAYFESKLSPPVRSKKKGGVHHVEFAMAKGDIRDKFRPDNIIIDAGDIVRWTNNNQIAHLFATSMFIGEKGIFTPSIKPGETWEYTFTKPGNYYLICFVHVGMIAKVTVLGKAEPEEELAPEEVIADEPIQVISDGIPMDSGGMEGSGSGHEDEEGGVKPEEEPNEEIDGALSEGSGEVAAEAVDGDEFTEDDGFMDDEDVFMDDDLDDEELLLDDEELLEADFFE